MSLCDIYRSGSEDKCRESPGLQLHTTKAFDTSNRCTTSRNLGSEIEMFLPLPISKGPFDPYLLTLSSGLMQEVKIRESFLLAFTSFNALKLSFSVSSMETGFVFFLNLNFAIRYSIL